MTPETAADRLADVMFDLIEAAGSDRTRTLLKHDIVNALRPHLADMMRPEAPKTATATDAAEEEKKSLEYGEQISRIKRMGVTVTEMQALQQRERELRKAHEQIQARKNWIPDPLPGTRFYAEMLEKTNQDIIKALGINFVEMESGHRKIR